MIDTSTAITTWIIDPGRSVLEFAVTHMMFTTAKGRFLDFEGTIVCDEHDVENSSVEVIIETGSIATGNADRDAHLRSPDFFDVETYPTATFLSTGVESRGRNRVAIHGELTIKEVTRVVVLDAVFLGTGTIPGGPEVAGFQATTSFNRKDFGLTWNVTLESGGVLVSDEVRLTLDIQAARADEQESVRTGPSEFDRTIHRVGRHDHIRHANCQGHCRDDRPLQRCVSAPRQGRARRPCP